MTICFSRLMGSLHAVVDVCFAYNLVGVLNSRVCDRWRLYPRK